MSSLALNFDAFDVFPTNEATQLFIVGMKDPRLQDNFFFLQYYLLSIKLYLNSYNRILLKSLHKQFPDRTLSYMQIYNQNIFVFNFITEVEERKIMAVWIWVVLNIFKVLLSPPKSAAKFGTRYAVKPKEYIPLNLTRHLT